MLVAADAVGEGAALGLVVGLDGSEPGFEVLLAAAAGRDLGEAAHVGGQGAQVQVGVCQQFVGVAGDPGRHRGRCACMDARDLAAGAADQHRRGGRTGTGLAVPGVRRRERERGQGPALLALAGCGFTGCLDGGPQVRRRTQGHRCHAKGCGVPLGGRDLSPAADRRSLFRARELVWGGGPW